MTRRPSRRALLTTGALVAAGGAGAAAGRVSSPSGTDVSQAAVASSDSASPSRAVTPFHGAHQAGITGPASALTALIGLDLRPGVHRDDVVRMLRLLTDDAARLTAGRAALGDTEPQMALAPSGLTVTAGFGPGFFTRVGLGDARPPSVEALPSFPGEQLDSRWGQSDLLLQLATDDPTTLAHGVRMLVKDARAFATVRWNQRGFRSGSGAGATAGGTPRNLLGQVDGTVNPAAGSPELDRAVWATGPDWFRGGTVMVLRRVRMDLETWDAFDPGGRDVVLGRRMSDGSPLTGTTESDVPDLKAVDGQGFPVIEDHAHIRLAHARTPAEVMLRRGFNYDEGPDSAGVADVGLLFVAYQADARTAFVPVQQRLAGSDLLNRWVTHVGSAVFALPPGCAEGEYLGQSLLGV